MSDIRRAEFPPMSPRPIAKAARLWWLGLDTAEIAKRTLIPEYMLYRHLDAIKSRAAVHDRWDT